MCSPRPREAVRRSCTSHRLFFRSLARSGRAGDRSDPLGDASDGTEGFKAIKAEVASPSYKSELGEIRRNAAQRIDAGVADYSLPLPRLAEELVRFAGTRTSPFGMRPQGMRTTSAPRISRSSECRRSASMSTRQPPSSADSLADGLSAQNVQEYLKLLHENRSKSEPCTRISRSRHSFFRDEEVFEGLKKQVPEILSTRRKAPRFALAAVAPPAKRSTRSPCLLEFLGIPPLEHNPDLRSTSVNGASEGRSRASRGRG